MCKVLNEDIYWEMAISALSDLNEGRIAQATYRLHGLLEELEKVIQPE